MPSDVSSPVQKPVRIAGPDGPLFGDLVIPAGARAVVLFAHGSGSSRHSPRNRYVARILQQARLATVLMDLLSEHEDRLEQAGAMLRFDVEALAHRLSRTTDWLSAAPETRALPVGYFGASTGAAAALIAAAQRPERVIAVVSRGGRPDLVRPELLAQVRAPTLLIVGGRDHEVLALNRQARAHVQAPCALEVVPGASHLFEEPGALEQVAELARDWFLRPLQSAPKPRRSAGEGDDGSA